MLLTTTKKDQWPKKKHLSISLIGTFRLAYHQTKKQRKTPGTIHSRVKKNRQATIGEECKKRQKTITKSMKTEKKLQKKKIE